MKPSHILTLFAGFILAVLLMRHTGRMNGEVIEGKDSIVFVKGKDSIRVDTVHHHHWHKPKLVSAHHVPDTGKMVGCDSIRKYESDESDSTGKLLVTAWVQGILLNLKTERACFNRSVFRTDTLKMYFDNTPKPRLKLFGGAYAGMQQDQLMYGLSASLLTKREDVFRIYGNPMQETMMIGWERKISFRRR